jgi:nicotinate phosphoribosyltransferase
MSRFDGRRLQASTLPLDWEGLRRGDYSDRYFWNGTQILQTLAQEGYRFAGYSARLEAMGHAPVPNVPTGDLRVEMQWFARRRPFTIVAGIDIALAILQECTGYWDGSGNFVPTAHLLEVEAVHDGDIAPYEGDPLRITPVLRVRGRYRDFAILETPTLGVLTRASRIATNTYRLMEAARGKPILFFPARYDLPATQAIDGYAYLIGVQRYNHDAGMHAPAIVSTPAQAALWGGRAGGTVAHAIIATFLGDTVELMLQFARILPPGVPRVALVDFDNDCINTALAVAEAFFRRYRQAAERGDTEGMQRYTLYGVRADTASELRDRSLQHLPDSPDLYGVNPHLLFALRDALDNAWRSWGLPPEWRTRAAEWCSQIKIVATGGFNEARIREFEAQNTPVDIYGVGSAFFSNSSLEGTNTDYTADVVRVEVEGSWLPLAKVGRAPCDNPLLEPVILSGVQPHK